MDHEIAIQGYFKQTGDKTVTQNQQNYTVSNWFSVRWSFTRKRKKRKNIKLKITDYDIKNSAKDISLIIRMTS
jgi:hypothetical protein